MNWKAVYVESRPHVLRGSRFRVIGVSAIGGSILVIWALAGGVGWSFAGGAAIVAVVVAAFAREARENARLPQLVLIGSVVDKGMRRFTDSGGVDGPAHRVGVSPRVTIAVREAFDLAEDGTRTSRPDEQKEHVIEQLRWYRALEAGDEVVLVCLPKSTDPVHRVSPAIAARTRSQGS
ncbi:MAG: hypothetical protein HYY06_20550 [Deltaproteobacteria bacterium]|nr:hypothetical protein [Deltaproteobacteria bacterium]